jgi:hypothetical protein
LTGVFKICCDQPYLNIRIAGSTSSSNRRRTSTAGVGRNCATTASFQIKITFLARYRSEIDYVWKKSIPIEYFGFVFCFDFANCSEQAAKMWAEVRARRAAEMAATAAAAEAAQVRLVVILCTLQVFI